MQHKTHKCYSKVLDTIVVILFYFLAKPKQNDMSFNLQVHRMKPAQEKDTMTRQAVGKSLMMFPEQFFSFYLSHFSL